MERTYLFNNSTLTIKFGDITESDSEVIVSSDDYLLSMGGGVSRSILKRSEGTILADTTKFRRTALGDVVVTSAGIMPQKYIFHCITIGPPNFSSSSSVIDKEEQNTYILEHCVNKCFALMPMLNISSIAFPCIGGGIARIPYKQIAKSMAEIISNNLIKTNKSLNVELYLFDLYHGMQKEDFFMFFENFAIKEMQNPVEKTNIQAVKRAPQRESNRSDVFISYSRVDSHIANTICAYLNSNSIKYWIDRNDICYGSNYKESIVEAIQTSKVFIFLSSKYSNASSNTIKEVTIAEKEQIPIIPVRLDDTFYAKSIYYDLCNLEWIDYNDQIPEEQSIELLLSAIRYYL